MKNRKIRWYNNSTEQLNSSVFSGVAIGYRKRNAAIQRYEIPLKSEKNDNTAEQSYH